MYTLEFFNNKTKTEKKNVAATKLLNTENLTVKQPIFTKTILFFLLKMKTERSFQVTSKCSKIRLRNMDNRISSK